MRFRKPLITWTPRPAVPCDDGHGPYWLIPYASPELPAAAIAVILYPQLHAGYRTVELHAAAECSVPGWSGRFGRPVPVSSPAGERYRPAAALNAAAEWARLLAKGTVPAPAWNGRPWHHSRAMPAWDLP